MAFNISDFEGCFERLDKDSKSLSKSELNTILGLRNAQKWMQCALVVRIKEFENVEREKIINKQKKEVDCARTGSKYSSLYCVGCRVTDIPENSENKFAGGDGNNPTDNANQLNEKKCVGSTADVEEQGEGGEIKIQTKVGGSGPVRRESFSDVDEQMKLVCVDELERDILGSDIADMSKEASRYGCFPSACCMPLDKIKCWLGAASHQLLPNRFE
jgi:hypothetical protein